MFGFLNIDKPSGITSHKIISVLRKITGIKQIGHAGTLDPLASGVLPVAIGKASKLIDYLPEDKEYIVTLSFGKSSDTCDIEGNIVEISKEKVTFEEIQTILPNFAGEIIQIPPVFSAVHYKGKRLYELARKGIIPDDIPKRKITIYNNDIINFDYDNQLLKMKISCSKGTYIRSIVRDIGEMTQKGAVMTELIRTKSGGMNIEKAIKISEKTELKTIAESLINPERIINLPVYDLSAEQKEKIVHGNSFVTPNENNGKFLLKYENKICALAEYKKNIIKPEKVFI